MSEFGQDTRRIFGELISRLQDEIDDFHETGDMGELLCQFVKRFVSAENSPREQPKAAVSVGGDRAKPRR